jgi:hypothetical protein
MVVTVFACWLGWELKFIRERQAFLRWVAEAQSESKPPYHRTVSHEVNTDGSVIPIWRRWLGDEPVLVINLPHTDKEGVLEEVSALFPEAKMGYPVYSYHGPADARQFMPGFRGIGP